MAITIDYGNTWIIDIPQADLTLVSGTLYELDTEVFRLALKDIEDSELGQPWPDTHARNAPVTVAGVTYAQSLEILPPYSVRFENGAYSVRLVGSNNNIFDVENGVLQQNSVQVISTNAAGLISPQSISDLLTRQEDTSYNGVVVIDVVGGVAGTAWPIGTSTQPVNNLTDAIAIATRVGAFGFHIEGALTLDQNAVGYHFVGNNREVDSVDLNGWSVNNSSFFGLTITGTGSGTIDAVRCALESIVGVTGHFDSCGFHTGPVVGVGDTVFYRCYSEVAGVGRPVLNLGGLDAQVSLRGYIGGLTLTNVSHANAQVSVDVDPGTVELAASCTGGTISVRGMGVLINNSAGSAVTRTGFSEALDLKIVKAIDANRVDITGTSPFVITIYDDDNTTVLRTLQVSADGRNRTVV